MHDVFILKQTNNKDTVEKIQQHFPYARCVEDVVDVKQLLKSVAQKSVTEHVWLFSDNCDYTNFDFEYIPPWHQNQQMHVWPSVSSTQSGDTVLFHRRELLEQVDNISSIQDFDCIHWRDQIVPNAIKPEIVIWDRYNNAERTQELFPSARVMRYIGTPLDMLRKTAQRATTPYLWIVDTNTDYTDFNFDWRPDWTYQNYLHVWPTATQTQGGSTMFVNVKHFLDQADNLECLEHYQNILWHDNTLQPVTPVPQVCIGTDVRNIGSRLDVLQRACRTATTPYIWITHSNVDYTDFDFSWQPSWTTDSHLHVWRTGTQTQGGNTYFVNVAEFNRQAVALERLEDYEVINWKTFSLPELIEPEVYIWDSTNSSDRLLKKFPNATVIRSIGNDLDMMNRTLRKATTEYIWVVNSKCDYSEFDFDWRPGWAQEKYMHVWPTENQVKGGDTMYVNVAEARSQLVNIDRLLDYNVITWHKHHIPEYNRPGIYVWDSANDSSKLLEQFPDATVIRSIGSNLDMMNRTVRNATTENIWVINSKCDYSNFDFLWRPGWDNKTQLHVWPTENQQRGGDTMYVNVAEFKKQALEINELDQYDSVNWHDQNLKQRVKPEVYIWDSANDSSKLLEQFPNATVVRNIGSKLDMMNRTLRKATTEYIWVVNSKCDYSNFDFGWRPTWTQEKHMHVWPTEKQVKGGDTMYVNVAEAHSQLLNCEQLEDYDVITWHEKSIPQRVKPEVFVWDTIGNADDFTNATVVRNIGSELDMMNRTLRKATTEYIWVVNSKCDYSEFDFGWRPGWSNETQLHVWPTENQVKGGDTIYVNVAEARRQLVNLTQLDEYDVINWHNNSIKEKNSPQIIAWSRNGNDVDGADITLRYIGSHLEMMSRTLRKVNTPYFWVISDNCDYTDFDFDWRPSWSTQHQLHVWPSEDQERGGDTMYVNTSEIKNQMLNLEQLEHYNVINWHKEHISQLVKPQIIGWSRTGQDVAGADITLRYIGSELDMMNRTVRKVDTPYFWVISDTCDYSNFNFNWRPRWAQEKYMHVWPTEDQVKGGDTMYVNTAEMKSQAVGLEHLEHYDVINWQQDRVKQQTKPQIVAWSRTGQDVAGADITLRYLGSELDMMNRTLSKVSTPYFWVISDTCDYSDFNFNWRPTWATQTYLHVWPTENQVKGGDTMYVNAAEMKSQAIGLEHLEHYDVIDWHKDSIKQLTKPQVVAWSRSGNSIDGADITLRYLGSELDMMNRTLSKVSTPYFWVISDTCDYSRFDFNWRPGWATEKYLHVWPTENQDKGGDTMYVNAAEMKSQAIGLEHLEHYDVINWQQDSVPQQTKPEVFVWDSTGNTDLFPDATVLRNVGDKFSMLEKTVRRASTPYIWVLNSNNDYSEFDFNWRPSWATQSHLHVWPSGTQTHGGDTMYVNVAEFKKQALEMESLEQYVPINWHNTVVEQIHKPDVVIWDGGDNTDYIKERFPDAYVMRNIGSRYDMMCRTMRHVKSDTAWVINSKCDYSQFDFSWRPGWDTETQLHVWPTENQIKGGDTYYIDVREFNKQSLEITDLDQYNSVNWHKQSLRLQTTSDIVIWTFGGNEDNLNSIKTQYPNAKSLRYVGTHLEMVKKSAKYANTDYFWVLSDCCEYTDFDANWRPDWETENSIHCWASGEQKFGDTFYVPKKQFLQEADDIDKLEYYSSVIWYEQGYSRLPWPVTQLDTADIFSSIRNHTFSSIYEYFVAPGSELGSTVDVNLWEKRPLIAYNKNGHVSLCPRDCISQISTRLADYPYIKYHSCKNSTQKPQDIVFISYDEKDADLNYEILKKQHPQAKRVHGVEGMVNALKQAAKQCDTPWYFAVFARTEVAEEFKFDFNPDYLETPGNYIFNAYNRITRNTYGHGAVLLYHCKTVIEAETWGYDFTTSFPYTAIPLLSCYNDARTPWEAWRTSFREVLKLKEMTTVESQYRLEQWLTVGEGPVGDWSIAGAKDAMEYEGGLEQANDWNWLNNFFKEKHSLDQLPLQQ